MFGECPAELESLDFKDPYAKSFKFGIGCNIKASVGSSSGSSSATQRTSRSPLPHVATKALKIHKTKRFKP